MGANTKIAWTDHTFNPVWGCTKVSPGCYNCYAEKLGNRFGDWWGADKARREFGDKHWREPYKWNRKARESGTRAKVFCSSMADVFDKDWPIFTHGRLWQLIRTTPYLDWILLTKRIGNAKKMLPTDWGDGYPNVWLIITVVNQKEAKRDTPKLVNLPATVRGLSIEPQLESIDIESLLSNSLWDVPVIDWVICGCESGPGRRPFSIDWARSLRDQCQSEGIAFFLKQIPGDTRKGVIETPELDGKTWVQFPTINGAKP